MVRQKKRYFVLSVVPHKRKEIFIKVDYLKTSIVNAVCKLYGEFGVAVVSNGLQVKYNNSETGIFYIRVNRDAHAFVAAALTIINSVNANDVSISCIYTTATLRHANIFLKDYHLRKLSNTQSAIEDPLKLKTTGCDAKSSERPTTMKGKLFKEKTILKRKRRV